MRAYSVDLRERIVEAVKAKSLGKAAADIRKLRPDTLENLARTFQDAVLCITQDDAQNAFRHCGYLSQ